LKSRFVWSGKSIEILDVTESNVSDTVRFLRFWERTAYTEDGKRNCKRMNDTEV
jgi:hypothetical protein